jgi:5'-AMP-activated protein kinase, regulatory gamma subunit
MFVGMMSISDFINTLRQYHRQNIPQTDLASKSIAEMLASPQKVFKHADFQTVDAEDTVHQLCGVLHRLSSDYVPVADPDEGNLVAILGYLDLVHLLHEACKQYPQFFTGSVEHMQIGTFDKVATVLQSTLLFDAIDVMESRGISGIPVTDDSGTVVGLYHRSDVSFITKAVDPDTTIQTLHTLQVGEALRMQQSTISETNALHSNQMLCLCSQKDSLVTVIDVMMRSQVLL